MWSGRRYGRKSQEDPERLRDADHSLSSAASSRFSFKARAFPMVGLPFIPSSRNMTSIRCRCSLGWHQLDVDGITDRRTEGSSANSLDLVSGRLNSHCFTYQIFRTPHAVTIFLRSATSASSVDS